MATLYKKELTVLPFCTVDIKLPLDITVVPLDVHKYKNCDKVIIQLSSDSGGIIPNLDCVHTEKNVSISSEFKNYIPAVSCLVEAPVKANVRVKSNEGSIRLINFNCDNIHLESVHGDITASKCYCDKIYISSITGNITLSKVMQAADIYLKTGKSGCISTGRLQGLVLTAATQHGRIKTESSYCDNSTFMTETGNLELHNVHKKCVIGISEKGNLNMTGFDGVLHAFINEGESDVQISRLQGDSEIKMAGGGSMRLKLSEMCVSKTRVRVFSKQLCIDKDINLKEEDKNEYRASNYDCETGSCMTVDCKRGDVYIQSGSWMDMFNIKFST